MDDQVLPPIDTVDVLGNVAHADVRIVRLTGFTAASFARLTDRGRLYASAYRAGANIHLDLYSDPSRTSDKLLCVGRCTRVKRHVAFYPANGSGIGGVAWIESFTRDYRGPVLALTLPPTEPTQ